MQSFDPDAPQKLIETLKWFGSCISLPLAKDSRLPEISGVDSWILPSEKLTPHQRIEIYHQQYWWRLLSCMHDNYPFLVRLMGSQEFNQKIAIPYLLENPPSHYSLARLGQTLGIWLQKHQKETLYIESAKIDAAANHAFSSLKKTPHRTPLSKEQLLLVPMYLQDDICLFELSSDLFTLREALLKESADYWQENPIPNIAAGTFYAALYRSQEDIVAWKRLSHAEYQLLLLFKDSSSVADAVSKLEMMDEEITKIAEEEISIWFHDWSRLEWLYY